MKARPTLLARWSGTFVAVPLAAIVAFAIGTSGWQQAWSQPGTGYGLTASETPVRLTIGDTTFLIPKNFIWSRGNWRNGKADGVNLHALLPHFEPYTSVNREEFVKPGWHRKVTLVLGEHSTAGHPAAMSRQLIFDRTLGDSRFREVDAAHGLRRLIPDEKPPAGPRDYFTAKLANGGFYFVSCSPDGAVRFPSCRTTVEYTKQVYVHYTFPKRLLSDWQAIDEGVIALVRRFDIKGASK